MSGNQDDQPGSAPSSSGGITAGQLPSHNGWKSKNLQATVKFLRDNPGQSFDPATRKTHQTSDHPEQRGWANDRLPLVLFCINPPFFDTPEPEVLLENGRVVLNYLGKPMRDVKVLPRHISVDVEPWRVVAWKLLDPKVEYQDVFDRMTEDDYFKRPNRNAFQQNMYRHVRRPLNAFSLKHVRGEPERAELLAVENMSYLNFQYNTILSSHDMVFDSKRLIKIGLFLEGTQWKARLVHVTRENRLDSTVELTAFHPTGDVNGPCKLSSRMVNNITLLFYLQHEADKQGLKHWSFLPAKFLPSSWSDRHVVQPKARVVSTTSTIETSSSSAANSRRSSGTTLKTSPPSSPSPNPVQTAPLQPVSGKKRRLTDSDLDFSPTIIKRTKAKGSSVVEELAPSVDVYDDPDGYTIDVVHSSNRFLATLTPWTNFQEDHNLSAEELKLKIAICEIFWRTGERVETYWRYVEDQVKDQIEKVESKAHCYEAGCLLYRLPVAKHLCCKRCQRKANDAFEGTHSELEDAKRLDDKARTRGLFSNQFFQNNGSSSNGVSQRIYDSFWDPTAHELTVEPGDFRSPQPTPYGAFGQPVWTFFLQQPEEHPGQSPLCGPWSDDHDFNHDSRLTEDQNNTLEDILNAESYENLEAVLTQPSAETADANVSGEAENQIPIEWNGYTNSGFAPDSYGLAPVNYGSTFVNYDSTFDNYGSTFDNYGPAPVNHGFAPHNSGFAPVNHGLPDLAPHNSGFVPVNHGLPGLAPHNSGFAPNNYGLAPDNFGFAPDNYGFVPINHGFAPINYGPAPSNHGFAGNYGPAPDNYGLALYNYGLAPDGSHVGADFDAVFAEYEEALLVDPANVDYSFSTALDNFFQEEEGGAQDGV